MDLNTLRSMVQKSRLLTDQERTYWSSHLEQMNPEQISKLERILAEAASIPWTEKAQGYVSSIAAKQTIKPS